MCVFIYVVINSLSEASCRVPLARVILQFSQRTSHFKMSSFKSSGLSCLVCPGCFWTRFFLFPLPFCLVIRCGGYSATSDLVSWDIIRIMFAILYHSGSVFEIPSSGFGGQRFRQILETYKNMQKHEIKQHHTTSHTQKTIKHITGNINMQNIT